MDEEAAFWLLSTICEDFVPEYYSRALVGSIVDQQLFENLVDKLMPQVSRHFNELGVSTGIITCPWFMCLFIGYVPLEVSLRILDLFFYQGKDILQKVGLAIFKTLKDQILEIKDSVLLLRLLKEDLNPDWKDILNIVVEEYHTLPVTTEDVNQLRNSNKFKAIKDLERINKLSQLRYLETVTKCKISFY